ncbi:response regulator transcription factor [Sulfurimonas sediminis]|uniref:Response regulator transcription factor n=1 Tax=Sulfurimonas sediminis TaxID=2590020 RepID=A0A7M1B1I9_9BACT|nr:response regulator transcription factor [Sulfurimonas sediminis]QOP42522.1 response regulator transcription factor [Sulfurimonas sediminis]
MNILIVEDYVIVAKQLAKFLKAEGYHCDVAFGYKEAQQLIDENHYALILLDWNLGDGDGLILLKEIRDMGIQTPVFMLSANSEVDDRVAVLDSGADDYLCKPYSTVELLARVRALLRRENSIKKTEITIGNVTLLESNREVFVGKEKIELTTAEFDLLELMMKNPNQVLTRYQLSEHINKSNYSVKHSNLVDVHVKNIRKKLQNKEFIKSIRGVGYKIGKSS